MNKLSKESKQKLILVALVTAVILAGLWFWLITIQKETLQRLANEKTSAEQKLDQVETTIASAQRVETDLAEARRALTEIEQGIASGDPYIWLIDTIREFKPGHTLEIRQYGSPVLGSATLLPRFPYRQASISISGTGYFHDIGKFTSELENHFPHIRLQNLLIEKTPVAAGDSEKLFFKMDVVALVKPS